MNRRRRPLAGGPPSRSGFTLIELLVAIAIGAMMMAAAIPALRSTRKPPSVQGLNLLLDAFREARARAVLSGNPTRVFIQDGGSSLTVEPAPDMRPNAPLDIPSAPPAVDDSADVPHEQSGISASQHWFTGHFPDDVAFRSITVNFKNMLLATTASVHFYPNGTCDLFDAILAWRQSAEAFHITLDVITGVPAVESVR
jgi:prepilin-type N-terminal cleavage/methylation domain-containing protein